jgi:hypothetical protein
LLPQRTIRNIAPRSRAITIHSDLGTRIPFQAADLKNSAISKGFKRVGRRRFRELQGPNYELTFVVY